MPEDVKDQIQRAPTEPKAIAGPQDISGTTRSLRTSVKPGGLQLTSRRIEEQLTQPETQTTASEERIDEAMPTRKVGRKRVKKGSGSHTRDQGPPEEARASAPPSETPNRLATDVSMAKRTLGRNKHPLQLTRAVDNTELRIR